MSDNAQFTGVALEAGKPDVRVVALEDVAGAHPGTQLRRLPLQLTITAPEVPGRYNIRPIIRLRTGNTNVDLPFEVAVEVRGALHSQPRRMFLASDVHSHFMGQSCKVVLTRDSPDKDIEVSSVPTPFSCALSRFDESRSVLELSAVAEPPSDLHDFTITVKHNGHSLELPVTLIRQAAVTAVDESPARGAAANE